MPNLKRLSVLDSPLLSDNEVILEVGQEVNEVRLDHLRQGRCLEGLAAVTSRESRGDAGRAQPPPH